MLRVYYLILARIESNTLVFFSDLRVPIQVIKYLTKAALASRLLA